MAKLLHFDNENFQKEVLDSDVPVLVDFWAPWCAPCRIIGPFIEQLAEEFDGKIKVGKLNVDDAPEIANRYGIRGIPTVIIFKNGEVKDTMVGAAPKEMIKDFIERNL